MRLGMGTGGSKISQNQEPTAARVAASQLAASNYFPRVNTSPLSQISSTLTVFMTILSEKNKQNSPPMQISKWFQWRQKWEIEHLSFFQGWFNDSSLSLSSVIFEVFYIVGTEPFQGAFPYLHSFHVHHRALAFSLRGSVWSKIPHARCLPAILCASLLGMTG